MADPQDSNAARQNLRGYFGYKRDPGGYRSFDLPANWGNVDPNASRKEIMASQPAKDIVNRIEALTKKMPDEQAFHIFTWLDHTLKNYPGTREEQEGELRRGLDYFSSGRILYDTPDQKLTGRGGKPIVGKSAGNDGTGDSRLSPAPGQLHGNETDPQLHSSKISEDLAGVARGVLQMAETSRAEPPSSPTQDMALARVLHLKGSNPAEQYNTPLTPAEQSGFEAWRKKYGYTNGEKDIKDYDLSGAYKAGLTPSENGHLPDTYKKPNHITFSQESVYSGQGGNIGGEWIDKGGNNWEFKASPTNLLNHSPAEMRSYFNRSEKDSTLTLPAPLQQPHSELPINELAPIYLQNRQDSEKAAGVNFVLGHAASTLGGGSQAATSSTGPPAPSKAPSSILGSVAAAAGTAVTDSVQTYLDMPRALAYGVRDAAQETLDLVNSGIDQLDKVVGITPNPRTGDILPGAEGHRDPLGEIATGGGEFMKQAVQFMTGFKGAGKLIKGESYIADAAKGALSDFAAFDGHTDNLANLWQKWGLPKNVLTDYLASSPDDSDTEGRFKNALQGIGLGALVAPMATLGNALRTARVARMAPPQAPDVMGESAVLPRVTTGDFAPLGDPTDSKIIAKRVAAVNQAMEPQRTAAVEQSMRGAGIEVSQYAKTNLHDLTYEQVQSELSAEAASRKDAVVAILGSEERATEYNRLSSRLNKLDPGPRAEALQNEMDSKFTPEEINKLENLDFKSFSDYQIHDLEKVRDAYNISFDFPHYSANEIGGEIGFRLRETSPESVRAAMAGQGDDANASAAAVMLRAGMEVLTKRGLTRAQANEAILAGTVARGISPADAKELLAGFIMPEGARPASAAAAPPPPPQDLAAAARARSTKEMAYRSGQIDPTNLEPYVELGDIVDQHGPALADIQAHGIAGAKPEEQLAQLLTGGVDPSRVFHTGSLGQARDPTLAAAGLGAKIDSPYILLSRPGEDIKTGGIAAVVANGAARDAIPELSRQFPGTKFLTPDQVPAWRANPDKVGTVGAAPASPSVDLSKPVLVRTGEEGKFTLSMRNDDPSNPTQDGMKHIAYIDASVHGDTIYIHSIDAEPEGWSSGNAKQSLGTDRLLQIVAGLQKEYPNAKWLAGERVSGMRFPGQRVLPGEGENIKVDLEKLLKRGAGVTPPVINQDELPGLLNPTTQAGGISSPADLAARAAAKPEPEHYINWSSWNGPEDLKKIADDMMRAHQEGVEAARRGTVTWAETKLSADQENAWKLLYERKVGDAFNAEQIQSVRTLWAESLNKLGEVAKLAQDNPSTANLAMYLKQEQVHKWVQEGLAGVKAESGRAQRALAIPLDVGDAIRAKQLDDMIRDAGGTDVVKDLAARVSYLAQTGKAFELEKVAEKSVLAKTLDTVGHVWINGLLSNPPTQLANFVSNIAALYQSMGERAVAARIGRFIGTQNGVEMGEGAAMFSASMQSIREAMRAAGKMMTTGKEQFLLPGRKLDATKVNPITSSNYKVASDSVWGRTIDAIGTGVDMPGRALMAGDQIFKMMNYRGDLAARAIRIATQEVRAGSLSPHLFEDRVGDLIEHPPEINQLGSAEHADYSTYNNAPSRFAQGLIQLKAKVPALNVIFPFIRTPDNLFNYALERTPLAPLHARWRADIAAGGIRQDLALTRMATGSMLVATIADMAIGGQITGAGPQEPGQKEAAQRAGRLPYSWYPQATPDKPYSGRPFNYTRLDPTGFTVGMVADTIEILHNTDWGKADTTSSTQLPAAIISAVMNNIFNKNYMQSMNNLVEAFHDKSGKSFDRFISKEVATLVPFSAAVAGAERAIDPWLREANGMIETTQSRIPGLSSSLPLSHDLYGRPKSFESGIGWAYDAFSPIWSRRNNPEPIDAEILRNGMNITEPDRVQNFNGVAVNLDAYPGAYERFKELRGQIIKGQDGKNMLDHLNEIVTGKTELSAQYKNRTDGPDGGKEKFIQNEIAPYSHFARDQLLMEFRPLALDVMEKQVAKAKQKEQERLVAE